MRVVLTGGSGFIGSAVVAELVAAGHEVFALARSARSARRLGALGASPAPGDLGGSPDWLELLHRPDGIIHLAATFDTHMAEQEWRFLTALAGQASVWAEAEGAPVRLIYTGGCWLYGPTGGGTVTERSSFHPAEDFAFMVAHRKWLLDKPQLNVSVVHPAMTWDEEGGAVGAFVDAARSGRPPLVSGPLETLWPVVHREDLAHLYRRVLEAGDPGRDYHGVAEEGVPVGEIAGAIARRNGAPAPVSEPVAETIARQGEWARGYSIGQRMGAPFTRESLGWRPRRTDILGGLGGLGGGASKRIIGPD